MGTLNMRDIFNLTFLLLLQICRSCLANTIHWRTQASFGDPNLSSFEVKLESSTRTALVQGGHTINFNFTISYRRGELLTDPVADLENAFESYCQYVRQLENQNIYTGGENILNCTNMTRTVYSNYTCNSSDGVNCIYNSTVNSTTYVGNSSHLNETRNATIYSEIVKSVENNITSLYCVNVTTPLVKVDPVILPQSHFNLSHQAVDIEVEFPGEFNVDHIGDLVLSRQFDNVTSNCTQFVVNTSYTQLASKPRTKIQVKLQFASNISWNGTFLISTTVSERVVPLQLLNVTTNVTYDGFKELLWIGEYTVPRLWFKDMAMKTDSFPQTPRPLLTDEEEVTLEVSFVVPSVTTNVEVFVKLPVFADSLPLKVTSARVSSIQGNIRSSHLRAGSNIGAYIAPEEVVDLNPAAPTRVKFNFGETTNLPGVVNSTVTLQVIGKVDSVGRDAGYVPDSFGNVTSWMVYSTAFGHENVTNPSWIKLELGQPQVKYEMHFQKQTNKVEGGDRIDCSFQFVNPVFATEAASVTLDISFASQDMQITNRTLSVCNVSLDTSSPSHCQNTSLWPSLSISNTNISLHVLFTNLTAGFGLFGSVVGTVLTSVSSGDTLTNVAQIKYNRMRWLPVEDRKNLDAYVEPVLVSSSLVSTSVYTTSQTNTAIGEKITLTITGTIPVTTNHDFAVVIGDGLVSCEQGKFIDVGSNLRGRQLATGTELNITSGYIPEAATTFSSPVFVGQFGTVSNTGHSTASDAARFILQVSVLVKNVATNNNNKGFEVGTAIYHNPNRKYTSDRNFKVVEPDILASVVASPSKDVQQNSQVTFTATIKHSSVSQSAAFNLLVQIAVPYPHLTLGEFSSNTGSIRTVPGKDAPQAFLSNETINSVVIVYENDVFQQNSDPVEIKYKTTTSSTLPPCEFITSPIFLFYTSLPKALNQSLARNYSLGPREEASFLTFRPDPYLTFKFSSKNDGQFDSGDALNFTIHVKNVGTGNVQPQGHDVKITIPISKTTFKDSTVVCNLGVTAVFSNAASSYTLTMEKSPLGFSEEISCNLTTKLHIVVPSQTIELTSSLVYHCLPAHLQHHYDRYYVEEKNSIKVKPLTVELFANGSTTQLLTGDSLEFNVRISLPEVTTSLGVKYQIPTISSEARRKRSPRQKRATQINVLDPDESQTSYSSGANLVVNGMSTSTLVNAYVVNFASIENIADNVESEQDQLLVKVKFQVVDKPLILSGRNFEISVTVSFPGGSASATASFSIVGPLVKPLLRLAKSFQVLDPTLDSPSGIFYVNVSHLSTSRYDAHDVNISDIIEGMAVIRDNEFPGTEITAPSNNKYKFSCNIPVIKVGQTIRFYYKTQFKVEVKTPKYIQTSAEVTWRSQQLNSPVYGPEINSDACVARNDTIKERDEPLYGFLALGAFLGLVIGFVVIIIGVCIFIKCCNKGRLVPYYKIFSGKTTYTALQEEEGDEKQYTNVTSIQQTESVIYIIALNDSKKTEKQLENLDIQATMKLDRHLEAKRQTMFLSAFHRVVTKLRTRRDISEEKSKSFLAKLEERRSHLQKRNDREYDRRATELKTKMEAKEEAEIKTLNEKMLKEIEEAKKKLDGADKKQTKEVLSMITTYYKTLETDVQQQLQLEYDLEKEQIKKDLSVNNRLSSKEIQTNLVKELAAESELSEEDAQMLVDEHLQAMAAVEKIHDDEKSRQLMTLEMRLEERKALAQEMREQQQQEAEVLASMKKKYEDVLENLVKTSQVSEEEAAVYRDKLLKDVENLNTKLDKQRSRQEQNLHERLTAMKKRKLEEKEKEHQLELKKLEESHNNYENPTDLITAYQEVTLKQSGEMQEMEREMDKNAAQELKDLRAQFAEEARREYKAKVEKHYRELIKKGVLETDVTDLLNAHDQEVARIVEVQQAQQTKQNQVLEEKLKKRRELLTEKMKAEQKEQEKIRKEEQKVLKNMIDNQVVISEEEKEKILREHEKNMAELESSLTLNKLRQKQMLEQKLEQRRAMKLDKLQQKHISETKRIKIENVDGTTNDADLLRRQEMEKLELMRSDSEMENDVEEIRHEMLKERMEALEEHNDRIGALITELQIQRANQIAEINMQQRALGQLQQSILNDLDEKGVLVDPETKEVLQRHQEQNKQLEKALQEQREHQEQVLKERLREKLKHREQTLIQEQKNEVSKYLDKLEANPAITRFRKAALKARHKEQLDHAKQQIEKEIEQSVNEIKLQLEVNRLKAIEKQSIQFIAALVKCGKIQEQELDSVLQVLFPTKKPEEIDNLLSQIYGPAHTRSSAISLNSSKPSSLEMKVIAQISPVPSNKKKPKPRFEKPEDLDDLPPPEAAKNLAPIIAQGTKGFNLQSTLQKEDSTPKNNAVPLGRVRLAPLGK